MKSVLFFASMGAERTETQGLCGQISPVEHRSTGDQHTPDLLQGIDHALRRYSSQRPAQDGCVKCLALEWQSFRSGLCKGHPGGPCRWAVADSRCQSHRPGIDARYTPGSRRTVPCEVTITASDIQHTGICQVCDLMQAPDCGSFRITLRRHRTISQKV